MKSDSGRIAPPARDPIGAKTGLHGHSAGGRDIFPLPLIRLTSSRHAAEVNDCLTSLNWMASSFDVTPHYDDANCMQHEVVARVQRIVSEWKLDQDAPSGAAALKEILRGRGLYSADAPAANLAPFNQSGVFLPADTYRSPWLVDVVGDVMRSKLDGDLERMKVPFFFLKAFPGL